MAKKIEKLLPVTIKPLLILLLSFMGHKVIANQKQNKCAETGSQIKVHAQSTPDHVGFCGMFSLRNLLHQYICTETPTCQMPAVLSLINNETLLSKDLKKEMFLQTSPLIEQIKTKKSDPHGFGFVNTDLTLGHKPTLIMDGGSFAEAIIKKQTLKSEECLSFNDLYPKVKATRQGQKKTWEETYVFYNRRALGLNSDRVSCNENAFGKYGINLELQEAFQEAIDKRIQYYVDSKNECPPLPLPELSVRSSNEVSLENIKKHLDLSQPVRVGIYIPVPGTNGAKDKHFIVITNHKTLCCAGICVTKYQVIDSLGHYWAPSEANQWVSEDDLANALWKAPQNDLTWIEKK